MGLSRVVPVVSGLLLAGLLPAGVGVPWVAGAGAAPTSVAVRAPGVDGVPGGVAVPAPAGRLDPPLRPPTVVVPFAAPPDRYGAGHRGVDLAAEPGAEVRAPAAGVVVFAGRLADRGVLSIDHGGGGLRTSLEPVTPSVVVGARVAAGQVVGTVDAGHPRCAPAVCLHWGVRLDGSYLDPMTLLAPVRVRLLPWDP